MKAPGEQASRTEHLFAQMLDVLETTTERISLQQSMAHIALRNWHDYSGDFYREVAGTVSLANELTVELGGMPVIYRDSSTGEDTATTVFFYTGYDNSCSAWKMVATDHGQPPNPAMPIREVTMTIPELRTGFETATTLQHAPPHIS